ncbi:hypothetical protein ABW20_dc0101488 [Dactylellina cionopaga]|nr:hypothetical protein ABW20_dc0101488 [Dactylellina cionopaga]
MTSATKLEDCKIVWLCPLEIELRAAVAMLDTVFDYNPPRVKGQNVVYTIGKVGNHTVAVVGYYQEHGLGVSGSMAAEVLRDLPNLEMGLLVGIAGGMPSPTRDIRLGDIAVAVPEGNRPGVVGYDLGKAGDNDTFELKHWQNATHPLLRSVINVIRAHNESRFREHLRILDQRPEFRRPGLPSGNGERPIEEGPQNVTRPAVHYGTILSGNSVIKSKARRDHLRDKYDGIAVEMEAAGMMTRLPVAVIRGISDFADSNKNNAWQPYAAIAAAAYAKEILVRLPSYLSSKSEPSSLSVPLSTPFSDQDVRLARALPEKWAFVGREEELSYLEKELDFQVHKPLQRTIVGLWGLNGVGKSQLAARFVCQQRSKHPDREIFWISGESQESFQQSIIDMLQVGGNPNPSEDTHPTKSSHEQRMGFVNLFFAELERLEDPRWLLVVDGIAGNVLSNQSPTPFDIHGFISRLKRGYILLTARRRDIVEKYHPNYEVKGLRDDDAVNLLQLQIDKRFTEEGGVAELAALLKGLPLALRLAISVISRYRYTVANYVEIWKNHGADSEFFETDEMLSRSLELSFEELETTNPIAAKVLTLFSFLDHRDFWYDLCLSATEDTYSSWLRDLAKQQTPFRTFYPDLADLSFIDLKSSSKNHQVWETHPAIQVVARQRAIANEQEYVQCAVSLVASHVPRSYEEDFWVKIRRLEPHATQCWSYIKRGKWGPNTNLTELESLGRLFRHVGRYEQASLIYRMIESGLGLDTLTVPKAELLADVFTNLGLVYTGQRKFDKALRVFQKSWNLRDKLGTLTPDASMSIMYNKAVVLMMTGRLEEAEENLRSAAGHFAPFEAKQPGLVVNERKRLYIRILNDIGEVLLRKGSVDAATQVFQHILDSQMEVLGERHPTILSIKLNLGRTYNKLNQFAAARSLLEEVVAIYTEWWGSYHTDTIRAVDGLAFVLMKEGERKIAAGMSTNSELQNAEDLWKQVADFYKSAYGDDSDILLQIKSNLQYLHQLNR